MLIVDAHEDLAWNMLSFNRDYTLSAAKTRSQEQGTKIPSYNDDTMLGFFDYQRGQVALVFATLFVTPIRWRTADWEFLTYENALQARKLYRQQLDAYQRLTDEQGDKFCWVRSRTELSSLLQTWQRLPVFEKETGALIQGNPVGLVVLMEGAEPIRDPGELDEWWEGGVRIIGPAWASNQFCGGTKEPGPLTAAGYALLDRMGELGFGLDLSHMDEKAALQALDSYNGLLLASHSNAQSLLKDESSNRHLSDKVIHGILDRDGMIGINFYNAFLKPGWKKGDRREGVVLDHVIDQIDYICQMAGDARHACIGTDFDGGFGLQSVPEGVNTIADLQKLSSALLARGYSRQESAAVLGENWLSLLHKMLPENS